MKLSINKSILALSLSAILVGCGGGSGSGSSSDTSTGVNPEVPEAKFSINLGRMQVAENNDYLVNGDMGLDHEIDNMHPVISNEDYKVLDIEKRGDYAIIAARSDHPMTDPNEKFQIFVTKGDGSKYANIAQTWTEDQGMFFEGTASQVWFPTSNFNNTEYTAFHDVNAQSFKFYDENMMIANTVKLEENVLLGGSDQQPLFTENGIIGQRLVDIENQIFDYVMVDYTGEVTALPIDSSLLPLGVSEDGNYAVFYKANGYLEVHAFNINDMTEVNVFTAEAGYFTVSHIARANVGQYVFAWNNLIDLGADFSTEASQVFHMTNVCSDSSMNILKHVLVSGDKFACAMFVDNFMNTDYVYDAFEIVNPELKEVEQILTLPLPATSRRYGEDAITLEFENGYKGLMDLTTNEIMVFDSVTDIIK